MYFGWHFSCSSWLHCTPDPFVNRGLFVGSHGRLVWGGRPGGLAPVLGVRDMKSLIKRLFVEEKGQDVIEYALLAAGISIVAIPTVPAIGQAVDAAYTRIDAAVQRLP